MSFFKKYGVASYSFGSESQPIEASYHFIEEVFRRQHPKVILLETFKFINAREDAEVSEMVAHRAIDAFGWTAARFGMIKDLAFQDSPENYICDIIKYHSRWSQLQHEDFQRLETHDICRGYQLLGRIKPIKYKQWVAENVRWDQGLTCYLASWILQIKELVESNGAQLVLYTAPFKTTDGHNRLCRALGRFCAANGLCYLNLLDRDLGLVMDGDYEFADDQDGHLNVYGAEKMTLFLGAYLMEHYQLKALSPNIKDLWTSDCRLYEELRFQELYKWKKKKGK